MLCWKKLLLHVICPKPGRVLGAYNLISRTQGSWDRCVQVLLSAQVGYYGTSWSLHSAAGFSLKTRIIPSNKITLVNNHRGNSVNYWRNNKKGEKISMTILLKHSLSLLKLQKVHIYTWRLVEESQTWREEGSYRSLVTQLGSSGFLGIIATVPVKDT